MMEFGSLMIAISGSGITRLLSGYLRLTHGISLDNFYTDFINNFWHNPVYEMAYSINQKLHKHQYVFVYGNDQNNTFYEFEHDDMNNYHAMFDGEEFILISLLLNFDIFRIEFEHYIKNAYSHIDNIDSILQYQLDSVITLNYDYNDGVEIILQHDSVEYFERAKLSWCSEELDEPTEQRKVYNIQQKSCGPNKEWDFTWLNYENEQRTFKFIETMVGTVFRRTDRNLFDYKMIN